MNKTVKSKAKTKMSPGEELGLKLLKSVKEMKAGDKARSTKVAPNPVAAARLKTGLSQAQFAKVLHISARTLQEWEQGRRQHLSSKNNGPRSPNSQEPRAPQ